MENIKKTMDWINYKGAFFTAVLFGLQAVDYKDFKAKNVLQ
jgi:trans-2-enoyl-CoA reductase